MENLKNKNSVSMNDLPNIELPKELRWEGTFGDYLGKVIAQPEAVCTSFQRLYRAILHYKKEEYQHLGETVAHYNIFDDPFTENHKFAVYDIDIPLMKLVNVIKSGADQHCQENRIILLRGPVGSAKSTITGLLSLGLEEFSKTDQGQAYKPFWHVEPEDEEGIEVLGTLGKFERHQFECPLHEEPLRILPPGIRSEVLVWLNQKVAEKINSKQQIKNLEIEGSACPRCDDIFEKFMRSYHHDWKKVVEKHLGVRRMIFSRAKRMGIAGVRPKSEKDQDASELSGETNYAALATFGDTVDPRTFNFRGHFEQANRGIFIAEEMLKAVLGFLYDYLGASQEHRIQPKGFMEIDIDEVIVGSTNSEEYERLKQDKKMEALRDRIIKIDVPYTLRVSGEVKIYHKWFNPKKRQGKHLAPGTIETASDLGIYTRLEEPKKASVSLRDKKRLYDGKNVSGFNDSSIRELRKEAPQEGMSGISPRFIHDQISNAFVSEEARDCVNFFTVISQIKEALPQHQHINNDEILKKYEARLALAQEDLDETLKSHLRAAVVGDQKALMDLYARYIDQVMAHKKGEKIKNPITREEESPDVEFMEQIENMVGIQDHNEFRTKIMNQMAKRARQREQDHKIPPFDWKSDDRLREALELYLFEQEKNKINWEAALSRRVLEKPDQDKIDLIQKRLRENFGYCEICSTEVVAYVASVIHRGQKAKK